MNSEIEFYMECYCIYSFIHIFFDLVYIYIYIYIYRVNVLGERYMILNTFGGSLAGKGYLQ